MQLWTLSILAFGQLLLLNVASAQSSFMHFDIDRPVVPKPAQPKPNPKVTTNPSQPPAVVVVQPRPEPEPPAQPPAQNQDEQGGSMQDCGIPNGPVAYAIGNTHGGGYGRQCSPASVVVGFKGTFPKKSKNGTDPKDRINYMGYINPRVEYPSLLKKYRGKVIKRAKGDKWNEPIYRDYGSSGAQAYIAMQVRHWKEQGEARGQSCVAVDIDNCDMINHSGRDNYGKVLDVVDRLNREIPKVQIRVLVKNPQEKNCRSYLKRSVAVGAFMEEVSESEADKISGEWRNPNQILVFARGSGGSQARMNRLERNHYPNSTFSHDATGKYTYVSKCTYHPGQLNLNYDDALVGDARSTR